MLALLDGSHDQGGQPASGRTLLVVVDRRIDALRHDLDRRSHAARAKSVRHVPRRHDHAAGLVELSDPDRRHAAALDHRVDEKVGGAVETDEIGLRP